MPKYPKAIREVLAMQDALMVDALNPATPAGYRAQVARAWDVLEERKRIIRMKPKPKDVDVSVKPKAKVHAVTKVNFVEADEKVSGSQG